MTAEQGRRERSKLQKRARIFTAARTLFAEHGYAEVTTQQIAEHADVAAGTVFRYAATKAELLMMVFNADFRACVERGLAEAAGVWPPTAAIWTALAPTLAAAAAPPADTAAYQRELMFGGEADPHRAEGLAIVADLEGGIARLLAGETPPDDAYSAARAVFACAHVVLVRASTGGDLLAAQLQIQIEQIVAGWDRRTIRAADVPRTAERAIPAGEKES